LAGSSAPLVDAVAQCVELRRAIQALERGSPVRELQNEIAQLERAQQVFDRAQQRYAARLARLAKAPPELQAKLQGAAPKVRAADQQRMATLGRLREIADRLAAIRRRTEQLETDALEALYAGEGTDGFVSSDLTDVLAPICR